MYIWMCHQVIMDKKQGGSCKHIQCESNKKDGKRGAETQKERAKWMVISCAILKTTYCYYTHPIHNSNLGTFLTSWQFLWLVLALPFSWRKIFLLQVALTAIVHTRIYTHVWKCMALRAWRFAIMWKSFRWTYKDTIIRSLIKYDYVYMYILYFAVQRNLFTSKAK